MSVATYIKQKRGIYYFQRRVPKDVKDHALFAGKPLVIEESLGTNDLSLARKLAADRSEQFEQLINKARGTTTHSAPAAKDAGSRTLNNAVSRSPVLSNNQIELLASEHYETLVDPIVIAFQKAGREEPGSEAHLFDTEGHEVANLIAKEPRLKRRMQSAVRVAALRLLSQHRLIDQPLETDKFKRVQPHPIETTSAFKNLCDALIDAELDAAESIRKLYEAGRLPTAIQELHSSKISHLRAADEFTIQAIAAAYVGSTPGRSPEWLERVRRISQMWEELCAENDIRNIRKSDIKDFLDQLIHCPTNWSKRYPNKSLREVISIGRKGNLDTLSPNTLRDGYLAPLKVIFTYAEEREIIDVNPARGIRISKARKDGRGTGFEADELSALFALPLFTGCASSTDPLTPGTHIIDDHRFWAPIIALFTGARTTEIAQLQLDEVHIDGALPHFTIQASADRKLKTNAARRAIPIHPKLFEFGFREYVQRLSESGQQRLFPLWLAPPNKGFADAPAQKFFRRSVIPRISKRSDPKPNFHSFRNSMKSEMMHVGVHDHHQNAILGHEQSGMTKIYGGSLQLSALSKSMRLVKYEDVDFTPLNRRAKILDAKKTK